MTFQVKSDVFSGPLEKLLELIEEKKLDITLISLAEVTADFLNYVRFLTEKAKNDNQLENSGDDFNEDRANLRMLADFLVIAAQLILIKSKAILPEVELSEEEKISIQNLEKRLEIYQKIRPMFLKMKYLWNESGQSFSREMFFSVNPVFYPSKKISTDNLRFSLKSLLDSLGSFFLETKKIERQLFTLEEKIKEIFEKISNGISSFSQTVKEKPKNEIIVMFLALLHLLRDRLLKVNQEENFGEIKLEKVSG